MIRSNCPTTGATATQGRYDAGYDAMRAARIERMKKLGILIRTATVFPRLPTVPAWADLSDEERRQSARRMELYAAMVEHMDANIGKLIGYLKTTGLYDNTLIIFLSDNGPEGNIMEMGPPWDNSKFEDWGKKGTFIQYGPAWAQVECRAVPHVQRVPVGRRHPHAAHHRRDTGVTGSGRISDAVTHIMDIPATILEAAGVAHPESLQRQASRPAAGQIAFPDPEQRIAGRSRSIRLAGMGALRQPRHSAGQLEAALALRALWDWPLAAVRS